MISLFDTRIQCEEVYRDWIDDAIDDEIEGAGDWEYTTNQEYGEAETY
jgi:hypothetical protein